MNQHVSTWTADLESCLADCRARRLSFSEIALLDIFRQAGITRNALIGKAVRLGLPKFSANGLPNVSKQKIIWTEEMDEVLRQNWAAYGCGERMVELLGINPSSIHYHANVLGLPRRPHHRSGRERRPCRINWSVAPPETCKRLTLLELEANSCRFPMWGEREPHVYCGNDKQAGLSYCDYHASIAYREAS
jgi:hypothetical protein